MVKEYISSHAWRKYWGDDAEYDITEDMETVYEKSKNKSCVYWNSPKDGITRSTDLPRSEDYDTEGWTTEFEDWGVLMVSKAIENGCNDVESVMTWIEENC